MKLVSQCPVKIFNNEFSVIIIFESCLVLFICTGLKMCFHIFVKDLRPPHETYVIIYKLRIAVSVIINISDTGPFFHILKLLFYFDRRISCKALL